MKKAAGFVIIYDDGKERRLLLWKPKDAKWTGTFSIPVSDVEGSNLPLKTAIQNIYDGFKIIIRSNQVPRRSIPFHLKYFDKEGNVAKDINYYIIRIDDLKLLRINNFIIPKSRMSDEIGWAGLIPWNLILGRIIPKQRTLLKFLELLMKNKWEIYNKFYSR